MHERSLGRELALLTLAQVPERRSHSGRDPIPDPDVGLAALLDQAVAGLRQHLRDSLDLAAEELGQAQGALLEGDLAGEGPATASARDHLRQGLGTAEQVLNRLSACLDLPRLLLLADQEAVRRQVVERVRLVRRHREAIDRRLDGVMQGWRLQRLPRIDRDILRLACVDLDHLQTPPAVACNEAVELANRYSDDQGRRMINGVLRRVIQSGVSEA